MAKRCMVTGGSGTVGSDVVRTFKKQGWDLTLLQRRPPADSALGLFLPWELGSSINESAFNNVDTLIHCAYDFRPFSWEEIQSINVKGSVKLLESARRAGIQNIVFISSISCFDGCVSMYGKGKEEVEKFALSIGATVIRPGLVFGNNPQSMFGKLKNLVKSLPLVPLVQGGKQRMYLINGKELAEAVYHLSQAKPVPPRPVTLAHPDPLSFKDLLGLLGKSSGKKIHFVSVPYFLVMGGLVFLEKVGIRLRTRSDGLKGLLYSNPHPDFEPMRQAGIQVQKFSN